jgi:hypothetical protein
MVVSVHSIREQLITSFPLDESKFRGFIRLISFGLLTTARATQPLPGLG